VRDVDVRKIREDFPILSTVLPNGKRLVYLDNAATTHKPVQVVRRVLEVYRESYANIHRSGHYLAKKASQIFENAREKAAKFLNAKYSEEIVFVWNSTHGVNLVALPLLELCRKSGKSSVLITVMEHHSNMLPWRRAASLLGLEVSYVPVKRDGTLDYESLANMVNERTCVIAATHASNVTGVVNDLRLIAKLAKEYGAYVFADGAQYAPHGEVNVRDLGVDFYVLSGHKMLAPEGTGILYGRAELLAELTPFITGGGTIVDVTLDEVRYLPPPHRFEAGTPNIAGIAGLEEAIEYLRRVGMSNIRQHEENLLRRALKRAEELEHTVFYGPASHSGRVGVVPFNVGNLNPHVVGEILNEDYGIAVRTGLHCAHPYHYALGANEGTVRASFYLYNTEEEVDYLFDSLIEVEKKFLQGAK